MWGKLVFRSFVASFSFILILVSTAQPPNGDRANLGVVFEQNSVEAQNAFKFALIHYNMNSTGRRTLDVQAFVDIINTADAFKLSRLICHQFERGVFSMVGAVLPASFDTLHSYTNTFQMPFVTPWFPEKVIPPSSGLVDHAVSMRPDYHLAVIDTINHYGWGSVIYVYDSHEGLLRLQQLYQSFQPGNTTFHISHVKRVTTALNVTAYLRSIERLDRWSNKYVVLDSSTKLAKDVLIAHVRDVHLGRRNYHYLLSGLVMDDKWEKEVPEFGAVNVTGFRVLDLSRKYVRNFMELWKREYGGDTISARSALMYDTVHVIVDSLLRLQSRRPEFFRVTSRRTSHQANNSKYMNCNPGGGSVTPFEHGEKISRLVKRTELDGLTGLIKFNEAGIRYNFTLQVVELTVDCTMKKVASWSDIKGFIPVAFKLRPINNVQQFNFERNKTYIITTTLESPYLSKETNVEDKDNYVGYCKDLADMLSQKLDIKYKLQPVKDGNHGTSNSKVASGWDGMVGEILRKEADMAIAPLQVTLEREKVLDFSKPFLTFDYIPTKKHDQSMTSAFGFLSPLSNEIWICTVLSFFAVSLVLFIVSRFSPWEWRLVSFTDTQPAEHGEVATTNTSVVNEFSFWNSMWYALGSFMQQGSEFSPRSISGRIVSTAWWFFTLIVVSSYTANLTSYLTIDRIAEPLQTHGKFTGGCPGRSQGASNVYGTVKPKAVIYSTEHDFIENQGWTTKVISTPEESDTNKDVFCDSVVTISNDGLKEFAVAFSKGSGLREGVNLALQSLKDDGQLERLIKKWFKRTDCELSEMNKRGSELSLYQVAGLFYILMGGLALGMLVALIEFCQRGRQTPRPNVPVRTALRTNASISTNTEHKTPQCNVRMPIQEDDRLDWNGTPYPGYYTPAHQLGQEETALQASFTQV